MSTKQYQREIVVTWTLAGVTLGLFHFYGSPFAGIISVPASTLAVATAVQWLRGKDLEGRELNET